MPTPTYQRSDLINNIVDTTKYPNITSQLTTQTLLNRVVRMVIQEIDLRSMKRRAAISPTLFNDIFEYTAPTDLQGEGVIDIIPQTDRPFSQRWGLCTAEYFDRKKLIYKNLVTVTDNDFTRVLRVSAITTEQNFILSELNSTTDGGGTWSVFGDATNLVADTIQSVKGGASLKFDLVGSGTTAGIQNSTLTASDITNYVNDGSAILWVYINSTTNLTNYILRIGTDSSNYYSMTVTTKSDGNAFTNGWNQLRFAFSGATTTGTPTTTSTKYVVIYMTKTSGKSDDGYRFDQLSLHTGQYYDILYYSKYPWQETASNTYVENSTGATAYLNATVEEFELFVLKGKIEFFRDLRDYDQMKLAQIDYQVAVQRYKKLNPSERIPHQLRYWQNP